MEITDVRVWILEEPRGKILANASITIEGQLVIRDFKILSGDDGPWVGFPSRKAPEGAKYPYIDIVYAPDKEVRAAVQAKIMEMYEMQSSGQGEEKQEHPPEEM